MEQRMRMWNPWIEMILVLIGALGFVGFDHSPVAWAEGGQWLCRAEGVYSSCSSTRTWRACQEHRLEGLGMAADKTSACMEAEQVCSEHLIRALILENRAGHAKIKSRCAMRECELRSHPEGSLRLLSKGF